MDLEADEILFVDEYLKTFKAGKTYKKLHPEVTQGSANTLGSRLLKKVEKSEYFKDSLSDLCMGKEEVLQQLTVMGRRKNIKALSLLMKYHGLLVEQVNVKHSWAEFVSSDTTDT
jgi:hypothetical protein